MMAPDSLRASGSEPTRRFWRRGFSSREYSQIVERDNAAEKLTCQAPWTNFFRSVAYLSGVFLVEVKFMQEPMDQRSENEADHRQENQPREERVKTGEKLSSIGI